MNNNIFDPGSVTPPPVQAPVTPVQQPEKKGGAGKIILIVVLVVFFILVLPIILLIVAGASIFGMIDSKLEGMDSLECSANNNYIKIYYDDSGINGFSKSGKYFKDDLDAVRDYVQENSKVIRSGETPKDRDEAALRKYGQMLIDESGGVVKCTLNDEAL